MPGSTPLGIRYPLGPEPPTVAPDMQRLAGDVDALITGIGARLYLSGAASAASGAWTIVQPLAVAWNQGAIGAASPNILIQKTGLYLLAATISYAAAATPGGRRGVAFHRNTVTMGITVNGAVGANQTGSTCYALAYPLIAGDLIDFRFYNDATGGLAMTVGATSTFIDVVRIS